MNDASIITKLVLSLVLGLVIGIERETARFSRKIPGQKKPPGGIGGIRTFSLISLLGGVAGILALLGYTDIFQMLTATFFVLVIAFYVVGSFLIKSTGLTTELAAVFTFLIGLFVSLEIFPVQFVIAFTIVLALILARKETTKEVALKIRRHEIEAFVAYAIIALVILPFLPNTSYLLRDIHGLEGFLAAYNLNLGRFAALEIVNPFRMWMIVALITGIDLFGHFLGRFVGEGKGWLVTSIAGGFVSSTATTQSLAQTSKKSKLLNQLVSAALLANLASFIQVLVIAAPLNSHWLMVITPAIVTMLMIGIITALLYMRLVKGETVKLIETESRIEEEEMFSLAPALKFVLLLLVIRIITRASLIIFGHPGFLVTSIIASFSGIDAVVVNLAEMAGKAITLQTALLTLLWVNATNLLSKSFYSFLQGKREFAFKLTLGFFLIIASSFAYFFLV